jgi:hypothetical protein
MTLCIAGLFFRVDVPNYVVRKAINTIPGSLCHFCEAFSFGLVLEGVAGEVDSCIV